jgi:hypothetical protein
MLGPDEPPVPGNEIEIREHPRNIGSVISLDVVPNGIFLLRLLAQVAALNGIPGRTRPRNLPIPWQEFSRPEVL